MDYVVLGVIELPGNPAEHASLFFIRISDVAIAPGAPEVVHCNPRQAFRVPTFVGQCRAKPNNILAKHGPTKVGTPNTCYFQRYSNCKVEPGGLSVLREIRSPTSVDVSKSRIDPLRGFGGVTTCGSPLIPTISAVAFSTAS